MRPVGRLVKCAGFGLIALALPVAASGAGPLAGEQVKVEGRLRPDGSFDAVQVVLRDVDYTSKVEGRLTSVRADRRRASILGFDVTLSDDTRIYRGTRAGASRAELVPGTWLEVKGTVRGRVLEAERVRIKDAAEPTEELEGLVERVDAAGGTLTLLGRTVRLPSTVALVDERRGVVVPRESRLRRDVDDQARDPWQLGSRVLVGGRLDNSWTRTHNYDLGPIDDRADQWSSRLQLIASAQLSSSIEAYGKVSLNSSAVMQPTDRFTQRDARVQEAYVMAHHVGGSPFSVQLGRQRFRDTREWFFDEYMDAARVIGEWGAWRAEAAVADGVFAGDVALRPRRDKRHWIGTVARQIGAARAVAFVVRRDDRGLADDDPQWLGGSFDAKRGSGSRVWLVGARRTGHRGTAGLGGWAIDGGATLVFDGAPAMPALTIGYARASGDAAAGDGRDTTFRQTDLEDNSARIGGLRRIAYYGELFDPELSNLQVWTAGLGFRPSSAVGIDLVAHRYQQSVVRSSIPSSAFDLDATGRAGLLGHELDAAVTFRLGRADLDLAGGVFVAGPGLGGARRVAAFWRPYVRLYF